MIVDLLSEEIETEGGIVLEMGCTMELVWVALGSYLRHYFTEDLDCPYSVLLRYWVPEFTGGYFLLCGPAVATPPSSKTIPVIYRPLLWYSVSIIATGTIRQIILVFKKYSIGPSFLLYVHLVNGKTALMVCIIRHSPCRPRQVA